MVRKEVQRMVKKKPQISSIFFDGQGHIILTKDMPSGRKELIARLNKFIQNLIRNRDSIIEEELSKKTPKELAAIILYSKTPPAKKIVAARILTKFVS